MASVLYTVFKIVLALILFGLLVFLHELGHFLAAKSTGVRVNEFALGMGPKLFSFRGKETEYSWRLFPIGGFCAMEGEDEGTPTPSALGGNGDRAEGPEETARSAPAEGKVPIPPAEPETVPVAEPAFATESMRPETKKLPQSAGKKRGRVSGSFAEKKVWQRMLITVAGVAMNLLLGYVLLLVYCAVCTLPNSQGDKLYATTTIHSFYENASSEKSGLKPGDTILKIDGKRVVTDYDMNAILQSDKDGRFDFTVRRKTAEGQSETVLVKDVQFVLEKDEKTGRRFLVYDYVLLGERQTFLSTLSQAGKTEYSVAVMVWRTFGSLLKGEYGLNDLSGPVGTVDIIGQVVDNAVSQSQWQIGLGNVLMLMVLLTVNLGVFNLLPLPALDGGRLVFLLYEGITRRKVSAKYEGLVHLIGIVLFLLLMVVVTFSDVRRLITG